MVTTVSWKKCCIFLWQMEDVLHKKDEHAQHGLRKHKVSTSVRRVIT